MTKCEVRIPLCVSPKRGEAHAHLPEGSNLSSYLRIIKSPDYIFILLSVVCCLTTARAQDLHFSQFFAAPLTTSPSNTGFFNGDWRAGGNFKSQWAWAVNNTAFNYRTFAAYCDFSVLKETLPKNDWMGIGAMVMNDRTGDGDLKTTKVFASAAYHKSFGTFSKYIISIGAGGGMVMKTIDYKRLYFNDQWNPDGLFFDTATSTGEPTDNDLTGYFDLSLGTHFTYFRDDNFNISSGIALHHLNKPVETFYGIDNRLGIRPVVSALAFTKINKQVHLEPGFEFMYQKKAQEYIINLLAGFTILTPGKMKSSIIFIGSAWRPRDAWIPLAGYQWKTLRVMLNYDVNLSTLTEASNADGGFEMSVVYSGGKQSSKKKMMPCPRL